MASSYKNGLFNLVLAILTGGATAFAIFAMPADLLESLVEATALPSLVTAAEPPLGATARLAIMTASATLAFALVWLVLGAFDPPRTHVPVETAEDDDDWLAPRIRRADAHPDAPVRRPLLAAEDLGEPLDELCRRAQPVAPRDKATHAQDIWSVEQAVDVTEEPLELGVGQIADTEEPASIDPVGDAPREEGEVAWDTAPLRLQPDDDEGMTTEELLARLPFPAQENANVSGLLQRLDTGLAEWPLRGAKNDEARPGMNDRLRDVLQDLQKMAGNG